MTKLCLKMHQITSQHIFISKNFRGRGGHAAGTPQKAHGFWPLGTSPPNDKSYSVLPWLFSSLLVINQAFMSALSTATQCCFGSRVNGGKVWPSGLCFKPESKLKSNCGFLNTVWNGLYLGLSKGSLSVGICVWHQKSAVL